MLKPLYIPKSKRFTGLHIECRRCNTLIDTGICKHTGKSIPNGGCPTPEKHVFKAIINISGQKNRRKTKILQSRSYDEAIKELLAFKESLQKAEQEYAAPASSVMSMTPKHERAQAPPMRLLPAMAAYVGAMCGDEHIPAFKRKTRSKGHTTDVERTFLRTASALKENGRDVNTLSIEDLADDTLVGEVFEYFTDELELGDSAFNRAITNLVSFYNWLVAERHTQHNPFAAIIRRPTRKNIETIEQEQFDTLIAIMQKPELGIRTLRNKVKKNYWKPFLPDAMKLLLYTGRRRTEAVNMKWSDAIYKDGTLQYIQVADRKVNAQKCLEEKDWIFHYVPGTEELRDLLKQLGEEKYRDTDNYIIAPEERMSRETMARLLSKSFSHYAKQLNLNLSLGCLRRTNFSSLAAAIGLENAQTVSGHSGLQVMRRHYISKKVLAQAAKHNVFKTSKDNEQKDISMER